MHTQHAKALLVLLSAALALLLPPAQAQTIRTAEAYQTDFDDAVSADFCGGAVMEFRYNPMPGGEGHTAHATNSFHSGYARLSGRYSNHVLLSLVAGGAQSPTLVNVENVPDGSGGKTNIYGYAAGIFSNATVRMTYTLYTASGTMSHTNLTVYLAGRKNDIPASAANVGPSPYRVPTTSRGTTGAVSPWENGLTWAARRPAKSPARTSPPDPTPAPSCLFSRSKAATMPAESPRTETRASFAPNSGRTAPG